MHRRAEYGVAAHWKYKEASRGSGKRDAELDAMPWLRQLVDWQRETADPGEFLDSLRFEMSGAEVYVFTPKGDVLALAADRKSTRLNSSHVASSYAVFCLKKKKRAASDC